MASLSGKAPHETWKELLKVNNDPTRNQGVTATLQRISDGHGTDSALAVSTTAVKVFGALDSGAITSTDNVTGLTLIGTGVNVGTAGQAPSATINTAGAISATSISTSGAISGGAISGTSLSAGAGTVTGGTFTGNAATVTNGVYTTSTLYVGTTALTMNRASAAQTLTGISIDGNAATAAGLAVHAGRNNEANKIVRTDVNGYLQAGYINSSNGNEGNASSPARIWGTNGSDDFLRSYQTSSLVVSSQQSTWTPTVAWVGQTPTSVTTVGRICRVGKLVNAYFSISGTFTSANVTGITISGIGVAPVVESAVDLSTCSLSATVLPQARLTTSSTITFLTNLLTNSLLITPVAGARAIIGQVTYEAS